MKTLGIGGSTVEKELAAIQPKAHLAIAIQKDEFEQRISNACKLMKEINLQVVYLHAGTNLYYFTGTRWNPSERMVGALLFLNGEIHYIAPFFEKGTILEFMGIKGEIHCWEEHENPYHLFTQILKNNGITSGIIAMDESTPFFIFDGIAKVSPAFRMQNAKPITAGCRMIKSGAEIAIMKVAMDITMEVQKAAAKILRPGISTKEVTDFIHEAHIKSGIETGSYFCIVLFGVDSSFPHGVKTPNSLKENNIVLVDTGCQLLSYISDITRTYVYGEISDHQLKIWEIEKETQQAAFDAAQLGLPCSKIDLAARKTLESHGLGPDYKLPGLPHRTGHGIGLDIHEWPFIVQNDETILQPGMCFSIEPMICVPNEFGIRHEDHIYMTSEGPNWFTTPAISIDNPFGIGDE